METKEKLWNVITFVGAISVLIEQKVRTWGTEAMRGYKERGDQRLGRKGREKMKRKGEF